MKLICLMFLSVLQTDSFKQSQLQHARVKNAYEEKEAVVRNYFLAKRVQAKGSSMFIRAFKKEAVVEVWMKQKNADQYTLIQSYAICASSGALGPKRKEGDLQVPEGIYEINHFNPLSNFHLSLGINYPNASDRILSDRKSPGGSIYMHGNCVTLGCIPLTDDFIKEVYVMAVEARDGGQKKIPIHIFPSRLDDPGWQSLKNIYGQNQHLMDFWQKLQIIYKDFEATKKLKAVKVNDQGKYYL